MLYYKKVYPLITGMKEVFPLKYWRGYITAAIFAAIAWGLSEFARTHTAVVDMVYPYMTRLIQTTLAEWSAGVEFCLWQLLAIVLVVAVFLLVWQDWRWILGHTSDSLRARYFPETLATLETYRDPMDVIESTDLRAECDGITIRVYQIGLVNADAEYSHAYLAVNVWGQEPFQEGWSGDLYPVFFSDALTVTSTSGKTAMMQDWGKQSYHVYAVLAAYGDQVIVTYDRYGQQFDLVVDLPWKERAG